MSLRDRLRASAHARFVGRADEVRLFQDLLAADRLPSQVVFVHGPGGVGKTTLLHEYAFVSQEAGVPCAILDVRDTDRTTAGLDRLLVEAHPRLAPGAPEASVGRRVLLVDTLEEVAEADDWLHRELLPRIPEDLLVVFAGRRLPRGPWTSDPSWAALVRSIRLSNLSRADSLALLADRGVDEAHHDTAVSFSRGHPLALALVVEALHRQPDRLFDPADAPETVEALLDRFLSDTVRPAVRTAIEACALVRVATEPLLEALLGEGAEAGLFDAVRALPIAELSTDGLVLHDLVRAVVEADLRWRAPERYAEVHARARRFYTDRLVHARTPEAQRDVLADYAFLYRDSPVAGPPIARLREALRGEGSLTMGPARPDEWPALEAMLAAHEGAGAAAVAAAWFPRQPDGVTAVRDEGGVPRGLLLLLRLDRASDADRAADPVAAAVWRSLRQTAAREGEAVLLFRSWMDREAHQGISPVQALVFSKTVWEYLTTPDLAVSGLVCARPHLWEPILTFAGLYPLTEAAVALGEAHYDVFGNDWRAVPPEVWLESLAARTPGTPPHAVRAPTPLVVLSREDFAQAVLDALRMLGRPGRLAQNPLLHSRLVRDRVGPTTDPAQRLDALRTILADGIQRVREARRGDRYAAALEAMYLRPAPSQEVASERVGVPFSTFRRHLTRGVGLVVERLWAEETR